MPIKEPIRLQEGGNKENILNLATHDPQTWNTAIDLWKNLVVANYIQANQEPDIENMYRYLETFIGETTKPL